ncbi:MAG: hypothetical protein HUU34_03865 [Saprospiraceae bacterium]|nr:hypothetical protein [Saprospiraceae bacterium]
MKSATYLQLTMMLLLGGIIRAEAQSYNTAMGMRLGTDWGVTIQQRVAKRTSIEAIVQSSLQREEAIVTLMGEQHMPFLTRRLNFYTGGGFHMGWGKAPASVEGTPVEDYSNPMGITVIAGLELSLGKFNISYDFKPAINIRGGESTFYPQTGISLRYVIIKRPWPPKKNRRNDDQWWKFWERD